MIDPDEDVCPICGAETDDVYKRRSPAKLPSLRMAHLQHGNSPYHQTPRNDHLRLHPRSRPRNQPRSSNLIEFLFTKTGTSTI